MTELFLFVQCDIAKPVSYLCSKEMCPSLRNFTDLEDELKGRGGGGEFFLFVL